MSYQSINKKFAEIRLFHTSFHDRRCMSGQVLQVAQGIKTIQGIIDRACSTSLDLSEELRYRSKILRCIQRILNGLNINFE